MTTDPRAQRRWDTRAARLADAQAEYRSVMTTPAPNPDHAYYDAGVVGFVFGEMWSRAGLTRKERRWITLACVGAAGAAVPIQTHVYASLNSGDCTLEELDEFNLHFATQMGWPKGQHVNMYVLEAAARVAQERGEEHRPPAIVPWSDPADFTARVERGHAVYQDVMLEPAPAVDTSFRQLGYFAYLYGEIWTRPVLTRKERRIVSICCAAALNAERELEQHLFAALQSRDLTFEELQELVLHYAVYFGWVPGAQLDDALLAAYERVGAVPC